MSILRLHAIPLTPIHIGTGEVIAPEDYLIQGDELIRFNPYAVLHDMSAADRREYERRLEGNEIQAAQRLLQQRCRPERHGLFRVALGAGAKQQLQDAVNHPERHSEVHPLLRNPYSGEPIVPGSSIKGAIRTALVNRLCQEHLAAVQQALIGERHKGHRWQRLEEAALGYQYRHSESDPLRLLKVADVSLPPQAVQVDRVTFLTKGKASGRNDERPLHYERLLARADGSEPLPFTVTIQWQEEQARHPAIERLLQRALDLPRLVTFCNVFYAKRMEAELKRFFSTDKHPEARYGAAGLIKWTGEKLLIAKRVQERGLLLRLGRFSHFESLSVDDLREGWDIHKKRPIAGMGSTRTLCETRDGRKVPFGWLLLTRQENP